MVIALQMSLPLWNTMKFVRCWTLKLLSQWTKWKLPMMISLSLNSNPNSISIINRRIWIPLVVERKINWISFPVSLETQLQMTLTHLKVQKVIWNPKWKRWLQLNKMTTKLIWWISNPSLSQPVHRWMKPQKDKKRWMFMKRLTTLVKMLKLIWF